MLISFPTRVFILGHVNSMNNTWISISTTGGFNLEHVDKYSYEFIFKVEVAMAVRLPSITATESPMRLVEKFVM